MIKKKFGEEEYELEFVVRYGLYNNCSYDDMREAMKEAIDYMKDSNQDEEITITLRWF